MNDPGLEDVVQHTEVKLEDGEHHYGLSIRQETPREVNEDLQEGRNQEKSLKQPQSRKSHHHRYNEDDAEAAGLYQPTFWWFASTAFPLFAGTFGPIANLFSVCALSQTWRMWRGDGSRISDPTWLIIMNALSLFCALVANLFLLFNFARRVRYLIAQPVTITFWYISCVLLIIPICIIHDSQLEPSKQIELSQSYYYALISCILYFSISTLLLFSTIGALVFHAYRPSFSTLTGPQRTLMLQTISFTLYLALGAGVFARIEGWGFSDGVYWADYTLLTIGLGTDFPLTHTGARMLLIPYAAIGITLIGLVISSVRGLLLERAKVKVFRRHLSKEREKWKDNIVERRRHAAALEEMSTPSEDSHTPLSPLRKWRKMKKEKILMQLPRRFEKQAQTPFKKEDHLGPWHRAEFELMRFIEARVESTARYSALGVSFFLVILLWFVGSVIFWSCEHNIQEWTFPESIYFTYTTLLTIGYGDFYPMSPSGKPFFVVWSLISVPAMTVLISNMGDTVVRWVEHFTVWCSSWTILPEKRAKEKKRKRRRKKHPKLKKIAGLALYIEKSRQGTATSGDKHESTAPNSSESTATHRSSTLEQDVEKLGTGIEHFEEEEGRKGSLAARLAREIVVLAKDLRVKPPKKYTWEEWMHWLDMLGEREYDAGSDEHPPEGPKQDPDSEHSASGDHSKSPPVLAGAAPAPGCSLTIDIATPEPATSDGQKLNEDWQWTWLGDQGPLLSKLTETEWIIEKLCFRLEEVLEEEIKEARAQAKQNEDQAKENENGNADASTPTSLP